MVATRDINPLEIILIENPAVVGPYSKSSLGCLQCFKKIDGSYICKGCRIPMCNEECSKGEYHLAECEFFRQRDLALLKENGGEDVYKREETVRPESSNICITPLRMLLKKQNDPKTFSKINMLMDHVSIRYNKSEFLV